MSNRPLALTALTTLSVMCGACDSGDHPSGVDPSAGAAATVPAAPVFDCGPGLPAVALQLPCEIGLPLGGHVSAVECALTGATGHKLSFILDLDGAARTGHDVGELPVLPFGAPQTHAITRDSQTFTFQALRGTASFSSVDVDRRALLGRFVAAQLVFSSASDETIVCKSHDSLFWATPGSFL